MAANPGSALVAPTTHDDPPIFGASLWWVVAHDVASGLEDVADGHEIVPGFFNPSAVRRMREFVALVLRGEMPSESPAGIDTMTAQEQALQAAEQALRGHHDYIELPTEMTSRRLLAEFERMLLELMQRRMIYGREVDAFRAFGDFCEVLGNDGQTESAMGCVTNRD
jgi:hypothetical protein